MSPVQPDMTVEIRIEVHMEGYTIRSKKAKMLVPMNGNRRTLRVTRTSTGIEQLQLGPRNVLLNPKCMLWKLTFP